jgi:hypothetical protein
VTTESLGFFPFFPISFLFIVAFLSKLIHNTGIDKRRGICRRSLGSVFLDRLERCTDRFSFGSRIAIGPLGEKFVGVFGIRAIAADKLGQVSYGFVFLLEVKLDRVGYRAYETDNVVAVRLEIGPL